MLPGAPRCCAPAAARFRPQGTRARLTIRPRGPSWIDVASKVPFPRSRSRIRCSFGLAWVRTETTASHDAAAVAGHAWGIDYGARMPPSRVPGAEHDERPGSPVGGRPGQLATRGGICVACRLRRSTYSPRTSKGGSLACFHPCPACNRRAWRALGSARVTPKTAIDRLPEAKPKSSSVAA